ncbi:hypothetical protein, partial [Pseudomonas glycinae]|uniref:hypothetical protein n=1 Tax=Pseudomonas glycinae TaxID=1785145 RepID=UPI002B1D2CA2
CRTPGQKPFGSFLAFEKGTRCKSETIRSRYRSNGYTPKTQAQTQNPDKQKRPALSRASCIDLISERGK